MDSTANVSVLICNKRLMLILNLIKQLFEIRFKFILKTSDCSQGKVKSKSFRHIFHILTLVFILILFSRKGEQTIKIKNYRAHT